MSQRRGRDPPLHHKMGGRAPITSERQAARLRDESRCLKRKLPLNSSTSRHGLVNVERKLNFLLLAKPLHNNIAFKCLTSRLHREKQQKIV